MPGLRSKSRLQEVGPHSHPGSAHDDEHFAEPYQLLGSDVDSDELHYAQPHTQPHAVTDADTHPNAHPDADASTDDHDRHQHRFHLQHPDPNDPRHLIVDPADPDDANDPADDTHYSHDGADTDAAHDGTDADDTHDRTRPDHADDGASAPDVTEPLTVA